MSTPDVWGAILASRQGKLPYTMHGERASGQWKGIACAAITVAAAVLLVFGIGRMAPARQNAHSQNSANTVMTGSAVLSAHNFTLVAYAATVTSTSEVQSQAGTVLEPEISVQIPHAILSFFENNGFRCIQASGGGGFKVVGQDLRQATFTARNGTLQICNLQSGFDRNIAKAVTITDMRDLVLWNIPMENSDKAFQNSDPTLIGNDTVSITAEFTNGQTLTKQVLLSFDKTGNLVAKLIS